MLVHPFHGTTKFSPAAVRDKQMVETIHWNPRSIRLDNTLGELCIQFAALVGLVMPGLFDAAENFDLRY